MSDKTAIQWTDHTWNPWRGCTKVSPGCKKCYMFTEQTRYGQDPATVTKTKTWKDPIKWQKSADARGVKKMVFTCSWSDWFHADADAWRDEAWAVIKMCPNLIFQILTKRPERIESHLPSDWGEGYPNVWIGVSAENQEMADKRIPILVSIPARVRFISAEPLIGPINFQYACFNGADSIQSLHGLHWIIVGGESGNDSRPFRVEWATSIIEECKAANVAFFLKQFGRNIVGCEMDKWVCRIQDKKGGDMSEWPSEYRIREFPNP